MGISTSTSTSGSKPPMGISTSTSVNLQQGGVQSPSTVIRAGTPPSTSMSISTSGNTQTRIVFKNSTSKPLNIDILDGNRNLFIIPVYNNPSELYEATNTPAYSQAPQPIKTMMALLPNTTKPLVLVSIYGLYYFDYKDMYYTNGFNLRVSDPSNTLGASPISYIGNDSSSIPQTNGRTLNCTIYESNNKIMLYFST